MKYHFYLILLKNRGLCTNKTHCASVINRKLLVLFGELVTFLIFKHYVHYIQFIIYFDIYLDYVSTFRGDIFLKCYI